MEGIISMANGPDPQQAIKPVTDAAQKAAKAGRIKSIKLKIKFREKKGAQGISEP